MEQKGSCGSTTPSEGGTENAGGGSGHVFCGGVEKGGKAKMGRHCFVCLST